MLEIRLTRTRVAIDKENHPIGSRKSKGWRSELVSLFSGNFHDQDLSNKLPFASNVGKNKVSQVGAGGSAPVKGHSQNKTGLLCGGNAQT